jgi:hypothetical protein
MTPFARIRSADPSVSLVRSAGCRLVLLTGQSVPSNTSLSPEQRTFLAAVAPPGVEPLAHGFPFHPIYASGRYRRPSLPAASLHNAHQFIAAAVSRDFRAIIALRLDELMQRTSDRLFLLTGSCGLQLLNAAWPALTAARRARIEVVALGPASLDAIRVPRAQLTTVQGARDAWSRWLFRGPVDHRVPCGHLDYWTLRETIELVRGLLASRLGATR